MAHFSLHSFHWRQATAVALLGSILATTTPNVRAADRAGAGPSTMSVLIQRLSERGVLARPDAEELSLLAEADAAESRAQAMAVQAAEARAEAAEARARAYAALLAHRTGEPANASAAALPPAAAPGEDSAALAAARERRRLASPEPAPRGAERVLAEDLPPSRLDDLPPARARSAPAVTPRTPDAPGEETSVSPPARRTPRATPLPLEPEDEAPAEAPALAGHGPEGDASGEVTAASAADDGASDTVRVTYVPEVVRQELREQVKQDVLDAAREEGWATPRAVPEWVSRVRFFGDVRFRYEGLRYGADNDLGGYLNFNALNTSASAFDITDQVRTPFPYYNVDQDRNRFRLRARLGSAFDLGEGFSGGVRLASGENNSPVTQNQSLGAAGSGQGGNFSKYALWLDRAFLRYEAGGLPDRDLVASVGRFDNPFLSTSMLWADDLGFDGAEVHGRYGFGEAITTFFAAGAFPVFNTDLNFATTRLSKFKSHDKWMYAAQLGTSFDLGESVSLKLAAAYYPFSNIEGELSTPFTPINAADPGDTDASRPAFAQKGNTYMPLRDILPGPLNQQGTINQFQYFGLASPFRPLVGDVRLEFNQFQPFQVALTGEYVKNLAFDPAAISLVAINNLGATPADGTAPAFLGSGTAWMAAVTIGDLALQKRWDWNVSLGYRKVGSDALVDGFADSDFGGGGTNVKGLTLTANLALSSRVWLGLRWMSASEVAGPKLKTDIFQFDLNGRY